MGKGVLVISVALLGGCATGPSVGQSGSMAPYADLIFDPHALDESVIQETRALEDFREGYGAAGGAQGIRPIRPRRLGLDVGPHLKRARRPQRVDEVQGVQPGPRGRVSVPPNQC